MILQGIGRSKYIEVDGVKFPRKAVEGATLLVGPVRFGGFLTCPNCVEVATTLPQIEYTPLGRIKLFPSYCPKCGTRLHLGFAQRTGETVAQLLLEGDVIEVSAHVKVVKKRPPVEGEPPQEKSDVYSPAFGRQLVLQRMAERITEILSERDKLLTEAS